MNYGCIHISDLIYKNWRMQLVRKNIWMLTRYRTSCLLIALQSFKGLQRTYRSGEFPKWAFCCSHVDLVTFTSWEEKAIFGSSSSQRVSKAPIMRQIMGLYGGHVGRKSYQNRMRSLTSVLIYFLIRLAETGDIPLKSQHFFHPSNQS